MFWPSTQPRCLIDSQNGFVETDFASSCGLGAGPMPRIPTRAIFPACCASAASGAARRPPAKLQMNARRVTIASAYRQREGEGGPEAQLALDPDPAAV